MAAARAAADPRAWCRVAGTNTHPGFQAPCGAGKPGLPRSPEYWFPSSALCESERPTALPLTDLGGAAPERLTFRSDASERISYDSMAWGAPPAEPPGRWAPSSAAGTAPGCWGAPPSPMGGPWGPVRCARGMRHRGNAAPPELLSGGEEDGHSDSEEEEEDVAGEDEGFPAKIPIYPPTDDEGEGEPEMKAAWELWPVRAPRPRAGRPARAPAAREPAALPGPGAPAGAILGTRPREAGPAAARKAAPPGMVLRRPLGIHSLRAAAAAAGGAPPPGVHGLYTETVAAPANATSVAVARPRAEEAALEWKTDQKDRRANPPRITTLVVRNLHVRSTQQEFLDEVNRSGFAEKYDFAYIPRNFEDGSGKGNGFINFKTPEAATAFAAAWHRSRRLGMEDETGQVVPLNVSVAAHQGLKANLRKWTGARVTRVKNPDFLPFVLRDFEPEPHASVLEPPGSVATVATKPR